MAPLCLAASLRRARQAFTLLEVVLAVSIGLMLLYALYSAMGGHLSQTDIGRELVVQGAVARGIFNRINGFQEPRTVRFGFRFVF